MSVELKFVAHNGTYIIVIYVASSPTEKLGGAWRWGSNLYTKTWDILSSQALSLTEGYFTDICEDEKQLMYTRCSYVYPSGSQCSNPIPRHLDPPLCGGHCDSVEPPKLEESADTDISTSGSGETERDLSVTEQVAAIDSDRTSKTLDHEMCTWWILYSAMFQLW